ncbi:hypothetical protein Tco_0460338, partial [Tanacetum coccineum]
CLPPFYLREGCHLVGTLLSRSSMLLPLPLLTPPLPSLGVCLLVLASWDLTYGKVSEATD